MTAEALDGAKILQINWLYSFRMVKDIIEKSIQLFKLLCMTYSSNNRAILYFPSTTLGGNLIKTLLMCVHLRMLTLQWPTMRGSHQLPLN